MTPSSGPSAGSGAGPEGVGGDPLADLRSYWNALAELLIDWTTFGVDLLVGPQQRGEDDGSGRGESADPPGFRTVRIDVPHPPGPISMVTSGLRAIGGGTAIVVGSELMTVSDSATTTAADARVLHDAVPVGAGERTQVTVVVDLRGVAGGTVYEGRVELAGTGIDEATSTHVIRVPWFPPDTPAPPA